MAGNNLYFAYGSNLSEDQMRERCPDSRVVGTASLKNHSLRFAGYSRRWDGGVATVIHGKDEVPGLLWTLSDEDLERLDGFECHPKVYERRKVAVVKPDGRNVKAWVYFKRNDSLRLPSEKYAKVIARGYAKFGFDLETLKSAIMASIH